MVVVFGITPLGKKNVRRGQCRKHAFVYMLQIGSMSTSTDMVQTNLGTVQSLPFDSLAAVLDRSRGAEMAAPK